MESVANFKAGYHGLASKTSFRGLMMAPGDDMIFQGRWHWGRGRLDPLSGPTLSESLHVKK